MPVSVIKALYLEPDKNYKEYDVFIKSAMYYRRCEQSDIGKVLYIGSYDQRLNDSLLLSDPSVGAGISE
jgi:hypothetical protein